MFRLQTKKERANVPIPRLGDARSSDLDSDHMLAEVASSSTRIDMKTMGIVELFVLCNLTEASEDANPFLKSTRE